MFYKIIGFTNINMKFLILTNVYMVMLFCESASGKNCLPAGSCFLQIGEKEISCNMSEDKKYRYLPANAPMSILPVRNLQLTPEDNSTSTWIDISGEFEITESSSPSHILIMMNQRKKPTEGKFYLLTFDSELLPKGMQNFNISCLYVETQNKFCLSVFPLISSENNSLKSTDLQLNNEERKCESRQSSGKEIERINLTYDEKDTILRVKLKMNSKEYNTNISLYLWKSANRSHCRGKLKWNHIINSTEFDVIQENEEGLFCITIKTEEDFLIDQKTFELNELRSYKCLTMERIKDWKPNLTLYSIDDSHEVQIAINASDKCETIVDVMLYNSTIYRDCSMKSQGIINLQTQTVSVQEKELVVFRNLQPGNYCATIYPIHDKCVSSRCKGFHTETVHVPELKPPDVHALTPSIQITTLSPKYVIFIVVATVCGLMAAGTILYLKYLKNQNMIYNRNYVNQYVSNTNDQVTDVEAQLKIINQKLPKSRILLLYSLEKSEIDNVIFQFIKVLEECCFCKVIHTMNDSEVNEIIKRSPSGWILYNIRHVDKIILIESQNTYQMQQQWINSEIIELSSNEECALLSGFITIHNKERQNDYNQLAVVRFNFTPSNIKLEDVVESCRYILPSSLPALFLFIHSKNHSTNNNPETETLKLSSEALQSFWEKESPVYNNFLHVCHKIKPKLPKYSKCTSSGQKQNKINQMVTSV